MTGGSQRMLVIAALSILPLLAWQSDKTADKTSPFAVKTRRSRPNRDVPSEPPRPTVKVDISPATGRASFFAGDELVASHPTYPLGARISVTNLANGKSVEVRIVGRFSASGRIINVSESAARQLDFIKAGTAEVRVEAAR